MKNTYGGFKLLLTIFLTVLCFHQVSYGQSYSNVTYQSGSSLAVGGGADVCATDVIINGTYSGGGTICSGPLPVAMLSFNADVKDNNVTLLWVTAVELNNSGFTVERKMISGDEQWQSITFIRGSGTTSEPKTYVFEDKKLRTASYQYRLKQIDYNGNYEYFSLNTDISIKAPGNYSLSQNYPNPSNPTSKIDFELPIEGKVTIKIFDVSGREVATLLNDFLSADIYTITFNGANFSSGVYFYTLISGDFKKTNKMILVK